MVDKCSSCKIRRAGKYERFDEVIAGYNRVRFVNMGHGEAILFRHGEDGGEWYLRDFGEYCKAKAESKRCDVNNLLNKNNINHCFSHT